MLSLLNSLGNPARAPGLPAAESGRSAPAEGEFDALFAAAAGLFAQPQPAAAEDAASGIAVPALPEQRQALADDPTLIPSAQSLAVAAPTVVITGLPTPVLGSGTAGNAPVPQPAPLPVVTVPADAAAVPEPALPPVSSAARPADGATVAARPPMPAAEAGVVATSIPAVADKPGTTGPMAAADDVTLARPAADVLARYEGGRPQSPSGTGEPAAGPSLADERTAGARRPRTHSVAGPVVDALAHRGEPPKVGPAPAAAPAGAAPVPTTPVAPTVTSPVQVPPRALASTPADDSARTEDGVRAPVNTTTGSRDRGTLPEAARVRQAADVMRQWSARAVAADTAEPDAPARHLSTHAVAPPAQAPVAAAQTAFADSASHSTNLSASHSANLTLADSQAAAEQLVQRVLQGQARHASTLHFELSPAELGQLQVHMQRRGDRLEIAFTASHAGARDLIEACLPSLRSLLQDVGIQLADVDVRHDPREQARSGAHGGGDQHARGFRREAGDERPHSAATAQSDEASSRGSASGAPNSSVVPGLGGIDAFA